MSVPYFRGSVDGNQIDPDNSHKISGILRARHSQASETRVPSRNSAAVESLDAQQLATLRIPLGFLADRVDPVPVGPKAHRYAEVEERAGYMLAASP